jgi:prepilin-type N-terminal cleavage/methylation domain-containing protein
MTAYTTEAKRTTIRSGKGYSLFELLVVIIILSIISAVSLKSLKSASEVTRIEQTKQELRQLAYALAGDPELISGGNRTDYGYVGDVGALPANLQALIQNPGGFTTWDGPYVHDDFYDSPAATETEFGLDAWGAPYQYSGGNVITSVGGTDPISFKVANSAADLLYNRLAVAVTDFDNSIPGADFKDSVTVNVVVPDGAGGTAVRQKIPRADGFVQFDSIPVGTHTLLVVYLPFNDTLTRRIDIGPGSDQYTEINLYRELW